MTLTGATATPEPGHAALQAEDPYRRAEALFLAEGVFWYPALGRVVILRRLEAPEVMATTEQVGNDVAVSWVPECPYDSYFRSLAEQAIRRLVAVVGHVRECDQ